ncbi:hypothetical protein TNCT_627541 [Trichonephila clavata]|uniref:Uncharacterized protein n=1 Tax=Trichonephila clavata TaxID=2740835 RepID=A0A8X6FXR6_TRICU|nr:hypothetical protein TNCT_627541 [Trichonephila clavata]
MVGVPFKFALQPIRPCHLSIVCLGPFPIASPNLITLRYVHYLSNNDCKFNFRIRDCFEGTIAMSNGDGNDARVSTSTS